MLKIDYRSEQSIYKQITGQLKYKIMSGEIKENERIPSVRDLSKELEVNPNTIQKSFKELEREGFIYTIRGRGTFANSRENVYVDRVKANRLYNEIDVLVKELKFAGVSNEEITAKLAEMIKD
ncbi:MAG: GntR family transcriptional regulator [Erysipelotrichaceae bacterium]|nr:GntR family transcriptional regulator [Erysipelotrichaceae bacterium]